MSSLKNIQYLLTHIIQILIVSLPININIGYASSNVNVDSIHPDSTSLNYSNQRFSKPYKLDSLSKKLSETKTIIFDWSEFFMPADFHKITCLKGITFVSSNFRENADFRDFRSYGNTDFRKSIFYKEANFQNSVFGSDDDLITTDFTGSTFSDNANFAWVLCKNNAYFRQVAFSKTADFHKSRFYKDADFSGSKFDMNINFENTVFHKDIYISGSKFNNGVDFTLAGMSDSTKIYYTKETFFQPGKLRISYASLRTRLILYGVYKK